MQLLRTRTPFAKVLSNHKGGEAGQTNKQTKRSGRVKGEWKASIHHSNERCAGPLQLSFLFDS